MSRELVAHNKPVFDQLHPRIYGTAVGLVAWSALMAWGPVRPLERRQPLADVRDAVVRCRGAPTVDDVRGLEEVPDAV